MKEIDGELGICPNPRAYSRSPRVYVERESSVLTCNKEDQVRSQIRRVIKNIEINMEELESAMKKSKNAKKGKSS